MVSATNDLIRLSAFLRINLNASTVLPSAAILTNYNHPEYISAAAWSADPALRSIVEQINSSPEPKPISEAKKKSGDYSITRVALREYFKGDNLNNTLVQLEFKLLTRSGYDIEQGFYFAIPYPQPLSPDGLFFLFAKNEDEAILIERNLSVIVAEINKITI
jgi:hypothetical protein